MKEPVDDSLFTCEVKFYLTADFPDLSSQPVLFVLQPEVPKRYKSGVGP